MKAALGITFAPAGSMNASQIARSSYAQGGDVVLTAQRENVDEAGNFSLSFAFTPAVAGRFHARVRRPCPPSIARPCR